MYVRTPGELALQIVNQRKKLKLSQAEVGDLVGLKQQTVSDFENRPENTKIDTLFRILSALDLDIQLNTKNELNIKSKWSEEW